MKTPVSLLDKVKDFLLRHDLARQGLVVAVSGGPDSVALLHALIELRNVRNAPPAESLVVAHLNHQLRGTESDDDQQFVQALCASFQKETGDLHFRCEQIEVAKQAKQERDNLESVARRLRYDWLAQVAREARIALIVTGHTADDQAETVLHRLLRGTGLRGLRGIAERRRLSGDIEVVRPLLRVTRSEVLAYLEAKRQVCRQDSSNLSLDYTRNRIRHELLPLLAARYNPAIVAALNRLAKQAADTYQDLELQAQDALSQAERPRAGGVLVFDRTALAALPRSLVRELLRLAWEREGWPMGNMGFPDWDRLVDVAVGELAAVDLPGGIRARQRGLVVLVGQAF